MPQTLTQTIATTKHAKYVKALTLKGFVQVETLPQWTVWTHPSWPQQKLFLGKNCQLRRGARMEESVTIGKAVRKRLVEIATASQHVRNEVVPPG